MRRYIPVPIILISLGSVGCGGARLDVSSRDSLKASLERMTSGMSQDEKIDFESACKRAVAPNVKVWETVFKPDREVEAFKPLHGMTATEIRERMREEGYKYFQEAAHELDMKQRTLLAKQEAIKKQELEESARRAKVAKQERTKREAPLLAVAARYEQTAKNAEFWEKVDQYIQGKILITGVLQSQINPS
jgi:hypothetical protein